MIITDALELTESVSQCMRTRSLTAQLVIELQFLLLTAAGGKPPTGTRPLNVQSAINDAQILRLLRTHKVVTVRLLLNPLQLQSSVSLIESVDHLWQRTDNLEGM